jgi:hypothetical protein
MRYHHIPLTVATPTSLFCKAHVDTMYMPRVSGYHYIVQGLAFVEALNWLAEQYSIHHIRISPYNSQANGIVECHHLDVREAIMKVCDGEEQKWPTAMHAVFWAEQITTHEALGHSTYYIAHGVEPLLPFNLAEATYMVPP